MNSINTLKNLSADIKSIVEQEYGSWQGLYSKIFGLAGNNYELLRHAHPDNDGLKADVQNKIYDIEDELNSYGLNGHSITEGIFNDFNETIITRTNRDYDDYLAQFGDSSEIIKRQIDKYLNH